MRSPPPRSLDEGAPDTDDRAAISEGRDRFLRVFAHELRNPLAALATALTLAERDERRADGLRLARRQLVRLTRLVDDVLDAVHLRTGQLSARGDVVDVSGLIDRAVAAATAWTEPRGQRLAVTREEQGLRVCGDPDRLGQVLGNLLHNASRFSEDGTTIELTIAADEGELRIDVRDGGEGIPRQRLERVFEPFRIEGDPGARAGGLGIGLAVARGLAELHGGSLELESAGPGRGTTAHLRLPLDRRSLPVDPVPPLPQPRDAGVLRVLLVDDDADVRDGLAVLVRSLGHEARVAANGAEALAALRAAPADLVFLDIGLPDADGYEIAARLRREAPPPTPRLVALSGYGAEAAPDDAAAALFDRHFVKPVDLGDLATFLKAPKG